MTLWSSIVRLLTRALVAIALGLLVIAEAVCKGLEPPRFPKQLQRLLRAFWIGEGVASLPTTARFDTVTLTARPITMQCISYLYTGVLADHTNPLARVVVAADRLSDAMAEFPDYRPAWQEAAEALDRALEKCPGTRAHWLATVHAAMHKMQENWHGPAPLPVALPEGSP